MVSCIKHYVFLERVHQYLHVFIIHSEHYVDEYLNNSCFWVAPRNMMWTPESSINLVHLLIVCFAAWPLPFYTPTHQSWWPLSLSIYIMSRDVKAARCLSVTQPQCGGRWQAVTSCHQCQQSPPSADHAPLGAPASESARGLLSGPLAWLRYSRFRPFI